MSSAAVFALSVLALLGSASAHRACLSAAPSPGPAALTAPSLPLASAGRHDHAALSPSSHQPSLRLRALYGVPLIAGLQPAFTLFAWGALAPGQGAGVPQTLHPVESSGGTATLRNRGTDRPPPQALRH